MAEAHDSVNYQPPESQPAAVAFGVQTPGYTLLRRIGGGSYGEVWLAQDALGTFRAIKIVQRRQFEHERPFQREFSGIKKFEPVSRTHPGLINILHVGLDQSSGYFYYVMELADDASASCTRPGEPCSQRLPGAAGLEPDTYLPKTLRSELKRRGGRLNVDECVELTSSLGSALGYLHQQGLVHRDIKPSNIIFVGGHPKLADIGLVVDTGDPQSIVGTEGFIPPEGPGTPRADIYSLGKLLYEISTGRDRQEFPELPVQLRDLPDKAELIEFNQIVLRACERDAAKRYESAEALLKDLALMRQGRSLRRVHWLERRLTLLTRFGAAMAVIALLSWGGIYHLQHKNKQIQHLADALRLDRYVADMNVVDQAIRDREPGRARKLLDRYLPRNRREVDLRGFEWRLLWQQCQRNYDASFKNETIIATCALITPDGQWLLSAGFDKVVSIQDFATGKLVRTLRGFDGIIDTRALSFSPNGRLLAVKGGTQVRVYDIETWEEVALLLRCDPNWNFNNSVVFSPDGLTLATRVPGGVGFWDATTWQTNGLFLRATNIHAGYTTLGTILEYSPDGRFLAVSEWESIQIRDGHAPGKLLTNLVRTPGDPSMRVLSLAFSTNILAAGYRDGVVALWNIGTWEERTAAKLHPSAVCGMAVSPNGRQLATSGWDQIANLWEVEALLAYRPGPRPILPTHEFKGHSASINSIAFSPDGNRLVSASQDGTVSVWSLSRTARASALPGSEAPLWFSPKGEVLVVRQHSGDLMRWSVRERQPLGLFWPAHLHTNEQQVAVSPEGTHLALARPDGSVALWDVHRTNAPQAVYPGDGSPVLCLKFSPNSARRFLAITSRGPDARLTLWHWNTNRTERIVSVDSQPFWWTFESLEVSPDGQVVAIANSEHGLTVYNTSSGTTRLFSNGRDHFRALAFSPDGARLAASTDDYPSIWLWDLAFGKGASGFTDHSLTVTRIAFTPDGRTLITVDSDNIIRFWNVALQKQMLRLPNYNPGFYLLLLCPEGPTLAFRGPGWLSPYGEVELANPPSLAEIDRSSDSSH